MKIEEIKEKVNKIKWHHKIDLGNEIITPGEISPNWKLKFIGLPEDLSGKTVLDIGAWDGAFSFIAEKRGAKRVLAIDYPVWKKNRTEWYFQEFEKHSYSKEGFELARKILNSKVEDKTINVLEISPENIGIFDIVLFMGVLYHTRHPLLALERVASVTKEMAIIETATDMLDVDRPAMAFYPTTEFGRPNAWCGPNPACVEVMLKTAGFKKVISYSSTKLKYRIPHETLRTNHPKKNSIPTTRAVFHAYK